MPKITVHDMCAYLDCLRKGVNEKIVTASPQEERHYLPELQIINAIEARVREMTAVEYLKAKGEMCATVFNDCASCPMGLVARAWDGCLTIEKENPRRAVEIVKRWKEEHHD